MYQMLYSRLDTGNFFVIPGLPVDVWAAETYAKTHTKHELREVNGFSKDDMVVLVIGSSFFYDRLSLDYSLRMSALRPLLTKYGKRKEDERSFKFVFLCGNSSDGYKYALQVNVDCCILIFLCTNKTSKSTFLSYICKITFHFN